MKRISIHKLYKRRNDVENDKPFFIYDEKQEPTEVALAIKIKDRFYNSDFIPENEKDWKKALDHMMKQVAIIQKTGWAKVQETEDEFGYPVTLMRCAYCDRHEPDPAKECPCRDPLKKFSLHPDTALFPSITQSGIIVP